MNTAYRAEFRVIDDVVTSNVTDVSEWTRSFRRQRALLSSFGGMTTQLHGHWERAERKLQAAKMEGAFPV